MSARVVGPDELAACYAVRMAVFVEEQKVPREDEIDGRDPDCLHFLVELGGAPVGTARMRPQPGYAKAERVAVLASARGLGLGAALMAALEREARSAGFAVVRLSAQVSAIPFYERIGYVAEGPVYLDAGIDHRDMSKAL